MSKSVYNAEELIVALFSCQTLLLAVMTGYQSIRLS